MKSIWLSLVMAITVVHADELPRDVCYAVIGSGQFICGNPVLRDGVYVVGSHQVDTTKMCDPKPRCPAAIVNGQLTYKSCVNLPDCPK